VTFTRPAGAEDFAVIGAGVDAYDCSGSSCRFDYAGPLPATLGVVAIGPAGPSEPAFFEIS
jgi:hypothetical protein